MTAHGIRVRAQRTALLIVVAGVIVQFYLVASFTRWDVVRKLDDALLFFLWPVSPYIVLAMLAAFKRMAIVAAACAVAVLSASLYALWFYLAAANPQAENFAYVLAYMPITTWAFFVPAGVALGLIIEWRLWRNAAKP